MERSRVCKSVSIAAKSGGSTSKERNPLKGTGVEDNSENESYQVGKARASFDTVHDWHAKVSKDDTVPHSTLICLFYLRKSFFPVDAEVSLKVSVDAQRVQDSTHRGDAKLLVVDHQDSVV